MQSDKKTRGAQRPKATIEGSVAKVLPDSVSDTLGSTTAVSENSVPMPADGLPPMNTPQWRQIVITSGITTLCVVILIFATLGILRFASDTTANGLRTLTGADMPATGVTKLTSITDTLAQRIDRLDGLTNEVTGLSLQIETVQKAFNDEAKTLQNQLGAQETQFHQLTNQFRDLDSSMHNTATGLIDLRDEISVAAQSSARTETASLNRESKNNSALENTARGFEKTLAALSEDNANTKEQLAALLSRQQTLESRFPSPRTTENNSSITVIREELNELKTLAKRLHSRINAMELPSILNAHDALTSKVVSGQSFVREFAALSAQLDANPALSALEPFADRQVPTRDMLAAQLATLTYTTETLLPEPVPPQQTETSIISRLLNRASKAVKIRRTDQSSGQKTLEKARAMLVLGNIKVAATIIAALPQSSSRDKWLADARAHIDLDQGLAGLAVLIDTHVANASGG